MFTLSIDGKRIYRSRSLAGAYRRACKLAWLYRGRKVVCTDRRGIALWHLDCTDEGSWGGSRIVAAAPAAPVRSKRARRPMTPAEKRAFVARMARYRKS